MAILFFLYNGLEVAFGTFIPVFAVKSTLGLTRADSSDVAAIFWGTFAGMRGLSVVLAVFAEPGTVMWGSLRLVGIRNSSEIDQPAQFVSSWLRPPLSLG